ncbi:MAG: tRNA-Thr(GGU) m(6)t(6)A37 methyltransferase TsaA [Deltaproteobacteria bacterium SG8_13]|nr:MAG: tRNA-Thr(GGU) m(6)t(6)A37 methyltransferase TsaA [Deltaproteobacteria bacterium SG8_13]
MRIYYKPIGVIHTPFTKPEGMPIQAAGATGSLGRVELLPEFAEGLKDLDGFSHIILLYHFHRCAQVRLTVTPFLDSRPRGLFATRAPSRPNAIGLSVVELLAVNRNTLDVANVDVLDTTPLLDIKPYVPQFDCWDAKRVGWLEGVEERTGEWRADSRFTR